MVTKIVFDYWVCKWSCKVRLWKLGCNLFGKEPFLSLKHKAYWCLVSLFKKDLIEDKKVLLVKVEDLKNIEDSLIKFVSNDKFSLCRETMWIVAINYWSCTPVTLGM